MNHKRMCEQLRKEVIDVTNACRDPRVNLTHTLAQCVKDVYDRAEAAEARVKGLEEWKREHRIIWSVYTELDAEQIKNAKLEAKLAVKQTNRDTDWILALGHAAGLDSGLDVPIVPDPGVVRRFLDAYAELKAAPSPEPASGECEWVKACNSYDPWDEYDSWGTSCGEDFAIVEEWHDKITPYCSNCGGKVIEEQKK